MYNYNCKQKVYEKLIQNMRIKPEGDYFWEDFKLCKVIFF